MTVSAFEIARQWMCSSFTVFSQSLLYWSLYYQNLAPFVQILYIIVWLYETLCKGLNLCGGKNNVPSENNFFKHLMELPIISNLTSYNNILQICNLKCTASFCGYSKMN